MRRQAHANLEFSFSLDYFVLFFNRRHWLSRPSNISLHGGTFFQRSQMHTHVRSVGGISKGTLFALVKFSYVTRRALAKIAKKTCCFWPDECVCNVHTGAIYKSDEADNFTPGWPGQPQALISESKGNYIWSSAAKKSWQYLAVLCIARS